MTEINAFGYEATYAAYKGGELWRQEMLKVSKRGRGKKGGATDSGCTVLSFPLTNGVLPVYVCYAKNSI